jgi:hypothetical protein
MNAAVTISDPAMLCWYGFAGDRPVTLPFSEWLALWSLRYRWGKYK